MLMAAYLPETSPIATPDQIILVLGDFPGDVWLDHGVILVATLGCDHLRSSGVATHMGEERIARNSVNFTWLMFPIVLSGEPGHILRVEHH
jgi:hypothetical protein